MPMQFKHAQIFIFVIACICSHNDIVAVEQPAFSDLPPIPINGVLKQGRLNITRQCF